MELVVTANSAGSSIDGRGRSSFLPSGVGQIAGWVEKVLDFSMMDSNGAVVNGGKITLKSPTATHPVASDCHSVLFNHDTSCHPTDSDLPTTVFSHFGFFALWLPVWVGALSSRMAIIGTGTSRNSSDFPWILTQTRSRRFPGCCMTFNYRLKKRERLRCLRGPRPTSPNSRRPSSSARLRSGYSNSTFARSSRARSRTHGCCCGAAAIPNSRDSSPRFLVCLSRPYCGHFPPDDD